MNRRMGDMNYIKEFNAFRKWLFKRIWNIEQDADIISFLYRDDYYHKETKEKDIAELIISKHRNGPTGTIEMEFMKDYGRFVER